MRTEMGTQSTMSFGSWPRWGDPRAHLKWVENADWAPRRAKLMVMLARKHGPAWRQRVRAGTREGERSRRPEKTRRVSRKRQTWSCSPGGRSDVCGLGELSGRPAFPPPRAPRHKPRSDPRGECPESCGCHPRLLLLIFFFFFFSGPLGSLISLSCHPFQSLPPCYLPWPWPFPRRFSAPSPTSVWPACPRASVGAHGIPRVHLPEVRPPEGSWGLCGPF